MLELMGHRQRVGKVSEAEVYGGKLLRIDIPTDDGEITEFYGTSSIYALRPISEAIAMEHVKRASDPRPVQPMDYRLEGPADKRQERDYDESDEDHEIAF